MDVPEGGPLFDPGSPAGIPLNHDTPAGQRRVRKIPEPLCSPVPSVGSTGVPGSPLRQLPAPSPSPGSKKYTGVSSNARNNIYLKTLLNSPYHKNFTPLSATPGFSPVYHTPARTQVEKTQSPGPGITSTPQGTKPPSGAQRFVTPKNMVVNPFDSQVDDLHLPAYISPGFFRVASTPASDQKVFKWSIEHIAELNPADIDEMPVHQSMTVIPDRETEERAQKAIEQFFASNLIHPSPWSDPKQQRKKNVLPVTPLSQGVGRKQMEEMVAELQGSIQKALPQKQGTVEASCQTALSLPVDFDLQQVLGAYMVQNGSEEEGNQQDMLSTSSLRRKLFFHGDTSSLAPSPVKGMTTDVYAEPASPLFAKQPPPNWDRTTPLRNTPTFSSSPIKSAGTPQYRRRSSDPEFLASPELSPIVHSNVTNKRCSQSRSSGVFQVHSADFDISPVTEFNAMHAGRDSRLSPIPFQGVSPDEHLSEDFRPKFEDSPGFSPIRAAKTPIRKVLRRSQEESYIQDECCASDEEVESVTPVSSNTKLSGDHPTPVESISSIHQSPEHRLSSGFVRSRSCSELQNPVMEFETELKPLDNILTSSLCDTRDFTRSVDLSDDTHLRTSLSNQDTGYQTASLQSTNQESASLHTNLTNQFNSLPFNVTNHDSSSMLSNQDKPPVLNLTRHFSQIANQSDSFEAETGNSDSNFSVVPKFPKQKLIFVDDDLEFDSTPKNIVKTKSSFEDSALPDDELSSNQSKMEIDVKGIDMVDPEEEAVLSRARQALAMAKTLYPREDEGTAIFQHKLPTELSQKRSQFAPPSGEQKLSASELAYSIIQRAGEDLARYGDFLSNKKTTVLTTQGLHGNS